LDCEKAQKQNKILEKKIKILQVELMQTTTDNELKKALADTMAEEDRKRKKKEAEKKKGDDVDLNNLIINDGETDSLIDEEF